MSAAASAWQAAQRRLQFQLPFDHQINPALSKIRWAPRSCIFWNQGAETVDLDAPQARGYTFAYRIELVRRFRVSHSILFACSHPERSEGPHDRLPTAGKVIARVLISIERSFAPLRMTGLLDIGF